MAAVLAANWRSRLDSIRMCLIDFEAAYIYLDFEAGSEREPPVEELVMLLREAVTLYRDASAAGLDDVAKQVCETINSGVNIWAGRNDPMHLPTFADLPGTLAKDELQKRVKLLSSAPMFKEMVKALRLGPESKVDEFVAMKGGPVDPWDRSQQPHVMSTRLSRFRPPVTIPPAATHPFANAVFQARCEIRDNVAGSGYKMMISPNGTMLAASSCGGYKNRDPVVYYWDAAGSPPRKKTWVPRLAHSVRHVAADDTGGRHLIFAGDWERIKSYSIDTDGKPRNIHTLKSDKYGGPMGIIGGGRLVRTGTGSAGIWNIDELETHYDSEGNFRQIGEGKYKGFEETWREDGVPKELSTGSEPHVHVSLADKNCKPEIWRYHSHSKTILVGEKAEHTDCYDCVAIDLEHGGKVTSRFIGHGGQIEAISTGTEGDPNLFATGCYDGYARLYDMRQPIPTFTMDVEMVSAPCDAVVLVHVDGIPVIFTGGSDSECIKLWDIRARKLVYELSTGNNAVKDLAWSTAEKSLFALTSRGSNNYRPGVPPNPGAPKRRLRWQKADAPIFVNDDEASEDSVDDMAGAYGERNWPQNAYHAEDYFGYMFDSGRDRLFKYSFKEDADPRILPIYGNAAVRRGGRGIFDDFW